MKTRLGPAAVWTPVTRCCYRPLIGHLSPACQHAADLSEAASPAEAELQTQEADGCAARRLCHQKTVTVRLEEDTGETHTHMNVHKNTLQLPVY